MDTPRVAGRAKARGRSCHRGRRFGHLKTNGARQVWWRRWQHNLLSPNGNLFSNWGNVRIGGTKTCSSWICMLLASYIAVYGCIEQSNDLLKVCNLTTDFHLNLFEVHQVVPARVKPPQWLQKSRRWRDAAKKLVRRTTLGLGGTFCWPLVIYDRLKKLCIEWLLNHYWMTIDYWLLTIDYWLLTIGINEYKYKCNHRRAQPRVAVTTSMNMDQHQSTEDTNRRGEKQMAMGQNPGSLVSPNLPVNGCSSPQILGPKVLTQTQICVPEIQIQIFPSFTPLPRSAAETDPTGPRSSFVPWLNWHFGRARRYRFIHCKSNTSCFDILWYSIYWITPCSGSVCGAVIPEDSLTWGANCHNPWMMCCLAEDGCGRMPSTSKPPAEARTHWTAAVYTGRGVTIPSGCCYLWCGTCTKWSQVIPRFTCPVPGVVHVNVNISRLQSAPGLLQRSWMASASRWTCNGAGWWPDHHGPQRLDPNFKQKHMNHYTGFPWTFNTCNYHVCQMLPVTSHSIDRSIHLWMFPKVCAKRVYAQICHLRLKCLKDDDNQWQWSSMIIETRGPLAQDAPTRSRKHTSIKPHMWNDLKISIDI